MNKNLALSFEEDIRSCVSSMRSDGVILYPTDTVWGIGCDALNNIAIDKVFDIKNRPSEKSLIVLLAEAKDIFKYVAAPPPDVISIVESFIEPTTIIFDNAIGFPENAVHNNGSIAIRVSKDPFCKSLIKRLQKPLISTSANVSGQPTAKSYNDIDKILLDNVDYVVKYRQKETITSPPSKIVKLNENGTIEIIRA